MFQRILNEIATTAGGIGTGATGEVLGTGATGEVHAFEQKSDVQTETGYTGALNIIDVDDLTAVTDVTTITGIWARLVSTADRKVTGQRCGFGYPKSAGISAY